MISVQRRVAIATFLCFSAGFSVFSYPCRASAVELDVGGFFRSVAVLTPIRDVQTGDSDPGLDVTARHRLMVSATANRWELEGHFVVGASLVALDDTPREVPTGPLGAMDYLRWPGASWNASFADGKRGLAAEIDRLVFAWHPGPIDVTVGRQPINLATTMLFTPHDVFAPFSPLDFFRAFKPGVDAIRLDHERLLDGWITSVRVSLIGALGYHPTALPDYDVQPLADRSAGLLRLAVSTELTDLVVQGGRAPRRWTFGVALQSDVQGWLLRLEHVSQTPVADFAGFDGHIVVAGVMRSLTPDLSLMLEGMVKHGEFDSGAEIFGLLALPVSDPWGTTGLDKWFADREKWIVQGAGALTWQAHPLVGVQGLLWFVDTDNAVLGNYTTYNFSNEGVAAGGFGLNIADTSTWFLNAELRWTW